MVKLIRLATTNEDGVFRANFDTDIILNENAQVAVRHCFFKNDDIIFRPTETSGNIVTIADINNVDPSGNGNTGGIAGSDGISSIVEEDIYRIQAKNTINQGITNTLNAGCQVRNTYHNSGSENGAALKKNPNVNGSCFKCRQSTLNEDKVELCFRYSPNLNFHPEIYAENYNQNTGEKVFPYIANRPLPNHDNGHIVSADSGRQLSIPTALAIPFDGSMKYRMLAIDNIGLNKGSSYFHAQIKLASATGAGFGMGIAFTPKTVVGSVEEHLAKYNDVDTLPDHVRTMEIAYTNFNTAYTYRLAATHTVTTHMPSNATQDAAAPMTHDVILFRLVNRPSSSGRIEKKWQGVIISHNSGVGSEEILFERNVTTEELEMNWQPYIWFLGKDNQVTLQDVIWTPDPFLNGQDFGLEQDESIFPASDLSPASIGLSPGIIKFLPYVNPFRYSLDPQVTGEITMSKKLEKLIGFKQNHDAVLGYTIGGDECEVEEFAQRERYEGAFFEVERSQFGWQVEGIEITKFEADDYFILETLGLPLDSFNSSEDATPSSRKDKLTFWNTDGARVNILDTIPFIYDEGVVIYSPNELLYVDILNSNKQNLRNLKVRILDQYRQPIKLIGKAEILLVIKD